MSIYVIKYYRDNICVSTFTGDDETIANALFHLNFYSMLPKNFTVTKTNADHKEFAFRINSGGYSWVEVSLNEPHREIKNN